MSQKKIAYIPVLNFNDADDLCSRMIGAESDMQMEGLEIIRSTEEMPWPDKFKGNEIGMLPWLTDEDLEEVIKKQELEGLREMELSGEALRVFLEDGGDCGLIKEYWHELFEHADAMGFKVVIRDFEEENRLKEARRQQGGVQ